MKPKNGRKYAVAGLAVLLSAALRCDGQGDMLAHGQPPRDLWRIVDDVTNCICGPGFNDYYFTKDPNQWYEHGTKRILSDGWFMSVGDVIEVQPLGIRVRGHCNFFGNKSDFLHDRTDQSKEMIFFIANYPYEIAENEHIKLCVVKEAGVYTYSTVSGGSATIRKFDYGLVTSRPVAPPPTAEEIQAAKAATAQKIAIGKAKALKYDKEMADKGDSYSQRRMGERFRDGDGVEKSLAKAHTWLALAGLALKKRTLG